MCTNNRTIAASSRCITRLQYATKFEYTTMFRYHIRRKEYTKASKLLSKLYARAKSYVENLLDDGRWGARRH